jgi:poly-gamma-glutamate capsule biosynthesis protein CapA/YwtB (metallophosphatase superfamily)
MLRGLPRSRKSALIAAIPVVALALVVVGAALGPVVGRGSAAPSPSPVAATQPTPEATAAPTATPIPSPLSSPTATPQPSPTANPSPVPLVPIVSFWSERRTISLDELAAALGGGESPGPSPSPMQVVVSAPDLGALGASLHVAAFGVRSMTPGDVIAFVKATPNALGIVRADDVALGVRAIGVDGVQLFGVARTKDIAAWPLNVVEPGVTSPFAAAAEWTIAAGGDVMLDKAVYAQSVINNLGVDYAWNGGTATIDRRYCCGWGGPFLAAGYRTGGAGSLAALFGQADLGLVNLESPEPHDFTYHSGGFTFTGDPALLAGIKDAGVDLVSLANNHLGNGGTHGITDTIGYLDAIGIEHAGAGANIAEARKPAWLLAGGFQIAVLAYSWIEPTSYWATSNSPGSSGYSIRTVTNDIAAARRAGAEDVIVMPHWGIEYTDQLAPGEAAAAQSMIAAGADLVLGSHSHWFGPMQQIGADHLVFYSLGDLIFDWTHDERTQESAVVDLTFVGRRLVQVDLHPTLIIDGQPNLLEPAGGGNGVLAQIRKTSAALLGW